MADHDLKPSRRDFIASYPPFRYWKRAFVDDMVSEDPINVYIHVPFCNNECAFCYYKKEPLKSRAQRDKLVSALCKEIVIASERLKLGSRPVRSLYIGGGTPTLLSEANFREIKKTLEDNFVVEEPEFTVEAEPLSLTAKRIAVLNGLGVDRISLGVQTFSDSILELNKRRNTAEQALKAIDLAMSTGEIVVNIDLLSGLAGETSESWAQSLDTAIKTDIHSITIYKMEPYSNTMVFARGVRKGVLELPSDEEELSLMEYALDKMEEADYVPWSFFTFTKGGKYPHVHSPSVWQGEDLYGFGPSSYGFIRRTAYQNTNSLEGYYSAIEAGDLPINRGYRESSVDLMVKDVLLGMKLLKIDKNRFREKHGLDLTVALSEEEERLRGDGFMWSTDSEIGLTKKGILYGDYVGKCLAYALRDLYSRT
jgi:oxygen-independent coproporphyrinogen-3 oxidase